MDNYIIKLFEDEPGLNDKSTMCFISGAKNLLKNLLAIHQPYVGWWLEVRHADTQKLTFDGVLTDDIAIEWAVEFNLNRFLPSGSGFDYDWSFNWDYDSHTITANSSYHTMDAVGGYGPVVPVQAIFQLDERNEYPTSFYVPKLDIEADVLRQLGWESCLDYFDETNESKGYDDEDYRCFGIGVMDDISDSLHEQISYAMDEKEED